MKPARRRLLLALPLLAAALHGWGCARNHQAFYPRRRHPVVGADHPRGARKKSPFVEVRVPKTRPIPSRGVDVPIVSPD